MFDRYVVAQTKPSWGRRALIIASVVLHGAAAAAFVIWSFFHVEEIVPPTLSLTVFSAPPPPPPPPPPAAHHKTPEHTQPKPTPHDIVQPTTIQKIVQPKEEKKEEEEKEDEDGAQEGGEEGGVKGGVVGGVKGGVVGGVLGGSVGGTGTDMNAKPAPAKIMPQFVLAAQKISAPDPHLPEWFKQQHAQQTVRASYKIIVAQNGRIIDVAVLAGLPGLDQTIIDQIKSSWQFKPQQLPVYANWTFVFKIN